MYIFLGRIFIGGITGLFGYLLITETSYYQVDQPIYATVVFAAIGGIVGSVFMSLFGHVSDSIVVVYVLDSEIQRNHHGKSVSPNTPEPL
jgi:tetrahydromethanopterin S-methyltransferase subunit E